MKTVLAPGAPWPVYVAPAPKKPPKKKRKKPAAKKPPRINKTDAKFNEWMQKQGELL